MTVAESCSLLVDTVRELSAARNEAASYRLVAQQAIHVLADQHTELERLRERYHQLLGERRAARPAA
jgi:hypothetical protein